MLSGMRVSPELSAAKNGPRRCRALGMVEQAVIAAEDEVVLVPEAVLDLEAEMLGSRVMDGEVVLLGPGAEKAARPSTTVLRRFSRGSRRCGWRLGREHSAEALRCLHPGLVEQRARTPRAMVRDERELARRGDAADTEEMVAVTLRGEVLDGDIRHAGHEAVSGEVGQQALERAQIMAVGSAAGTKVRQLHGQRRARTQGPHR